MIRLFCSDFDGTLSPGTHISQKNVDAIRRLQQAGVTFALVSGRPLANALKILKKHDLVIPTITSNGGVVTTAEGQELLCAGIDHSALEDLLREAKERHSFFIAYEKDRCFVPSWTPLVRFEGIAKWVQKKTGILPTRLNPEALPLWTVTKFNYYPWGAPDEKDWQRWQADERVYVTTSSRHKLELSAKGVSKWNGITVLAKAMGMDREEIAAIGDYLNDVSMVQEAKIGFAVANAHASLKACADVVVASAGDDGVCEAIDRVLQSNSHSVKTTEGVAMALEKRKE